VSDTTPDHTPPTEAELDALEALLGRATPGPMSWKKAGATRTGVATGALCTPTTTAGYFFEDDGLLLVALRNAAPRLLAAAREANRLRAFPSRCAFCEKHPLKAAVEENGMLRAALAATKRCDTPDCPDDSVIGLCWDHALTPLDGATATLKACLEAECVERQKAEDQRDALAAEVATLKARLEEAEGLLREALLYVASAAEKQHGYGHFPGGDPRKFTPDEDGTLPEERKAWEEACAKAENVAPAGEWIPAGEGHGGIHVTWQRFGLGVYTYRDEEAVAAKAAIDAFLAPAPASGAPERGGVGA